MVQTFHSCLSLFYVYQSQAAKIPKDLRVWSLTRFDQYKSCKYLLKSKVIVSNFFEIRTRKSQVNSSHNWYQ